MTEWRSAVAAGVSAVAAAPVIAPAIAPSDEIHIRVVIVTEGGGEGC